MTISDISLEHYLILSSLLFSIGVAGLFMNRKSVITILMSIELMLLAVNINFVAFSVYLQDIVGQVFSIIVLSIAAAEVSIGLAILVLYFRNRNSIEIEDINQMKG
ncbi:MAG: NADH-quinone oxidoreductase subunit NuoK [Rickettsiales bacterium]|jgi:NADH-quinone oxidoreductase subunit K|nr:NADH-quinone oxidoreductase subunit NuoK [Rickettsiales bacterium]MCA0254748.1 NADH-quinone oxidoreductase subunit NuoK [Pseudomonadota bacterium]